MKLAYLKQKYGYLKLVAGAVLLTLSFTGETNADWGWLKCKMNCNSKTDCSKDKDLANNCKDNCKNGQDTRCYKGYMESALARCPTGEEVLDSIKEGKLTKFRGREAFTVLGKKVDFEVIGPLGKENIQNLLESFNQGKLDISVRTSAVKSYTDPTICTYAFRVNNKTLDRIDLRTNCPFFYSKYSGLGYFCDNEDNKPITKAKPSATNDEPIMQNSTEQESLIPSQPEPELSPQVSEEEMMEKEVLPKEGLPKPATPSLGENPYIAGKGLDITQAVEKRAMDMRLKQSSEEALDLKSEIEEKLQEAQKKSDRTNIEKYTNQLAYVQSKIDSR